MFSPSMRLNLSSTALSASDVITGTPTSVYNSLLPSENSL